MIQIVLLRNGHCHPVGFPKGLVVPNAHDLFANLGTILDQLRAKDPGNLTNVYYTVAHHADLGGPKPSRVEGTFEYQTLLPFDIDYVEQTRAWEYLSVVAKVLGVSPQSLIFSSTGNGLHLLAHLKTPIRSAKYFKEMRPAYNEVVFKINEGLKDAHLPGQADPAVWDAGRILRLPNTINSSEKKGVKEAKLLQYPGLVPLDLDILKLSGLDRLALENITPAQLKKNYPKPDFQEVMKECRFMGWMKEKPEAVHEPHFMMALGLLGAISPGDKSVYDNEEKTAKEIASGIYDKACNSKSLKEGDFERKWEHGTRYGAPKCSTISSQWIGGCEQCPHFNKINTPLALKSADHVSSTGNGYWVMGKNGPLHPHYSDLAKIYRREFSYVTCEPDRIFTFDQTHYKPTGALTVKSWLEKKTGYEEHMREAHRTEFLKKILVSNALSEQAEVDLFEQTIRGRLNCANGVVDILRGELIPHAPTVGFRYVLPYDFVPNDASEFFLSWLAEVMQDRIELIEAILDMMAYCLWPTYDDHVFAYFVGEGRNGKSTLMRIMFALLGKDNYSAVSLAQLGGNRFAPANLEGKLANISEESSGSDLSFEELNVIKDLSAGGEIMAEQKGKQGFVLRNRAKLIFSANKTPRFHESGRAIRSRLLVIPFDHTFENPDERVAEKLLQEVPKICSMLVRRIQENLRTNGGKFKVSRGGQAALQAQEKVLLAGNSVVEWGKDQIESGAAIPEEKYIVVQEAYVRYTHWCAENNFKPVNSTTFGHTMTHSVLTNLISNSKVVRVGGKILRVYPRTQWKEEVVQ